MLTRVTRRFAPQISTAGQPYHCGTVASASVCVWPPCDAALAIRMAAIDGSVSVMLARHRSVGRKGLPFDRPLSHVQSAITCRYKTVDPTPDRAQAASAADLKRSSLVKVTAVFRPRQSPPDPSCARPGVGVRSKSRFCIWVTSRVRRS
jgi:hypothetical protein